MTLEPTPAGSNDAGEDESDPDLDLVWDELPDIGVPLYGIDERPGTWWETLLYSWQHTLVDISPFITPLAVAAALGMSRSQEASFINSCLFAMGVATLLQTTLGNRLPIIQGPSATLIGTMAPVASQLGGPAMWAGAFVGGLIEAAIGATGVLRYLKNLFPPVVAGTVIVAIGLSLGNLAIRLSFGDGHPMSFFLAVLCMATVLVLRFALARSFGGLLGRGAIFFTIWTIGLGVGSSLGLVDWSLVAAKPWVALPRLFPWGSPFSDWQWVPAAILVIFAGYLGSIVESIGDYAATCAVSGTRFRVEHMNRGIFAEGVGSATAVALGGLPCTSFTQNIGVIATTRVASRVVVQGAAGVLILYGLSPKIGALLAAMPRPVLGGVFILICGMIVVSGIRLLGSSLASPTVAFHTGTTLVIALATPAWARNGMSPERLESLSIFTRLILTNSVVLAVLLGVGLHVILGLFPASRD